MKIIKYVPNVSKQKDASVKNQIINEVNWIIYRDKKNKSTHEVLLNVSYSPNDKSFSNLSINLFWTKNYGFFRATHAEKTINECLNTQHIESITKEWGKSAKSKVPLFKKKDAAKGIYNGIVKFIESHDLDGKSEVHISIAQAEIEID